MKYILVFALISGGTMPPFMQQYDSREKCERAKVDVLRQAEAQSKWGTFLRLCIPTNEADKP